LIHAEFAKNSQRAEKKYLEPAEKSEPDKPGQYCRCACPVSFGAAPPGQSCILVSTNIFATLWLVIQVQSTEYLCNQ